MHDIDALNALFGNALTITESGVSVSDAAELASTKMDELVSAAVFGDDHAKEYARGLIWGIGQAASVPAAPIHDLSNRPGKGRTHRVPVPPLTNRRRAYH